MSFSVRFMFGKITKNREMSMTFILLIRRDVFLLMAPRARINLR